MTKDKWNSKFYDSKFNYVSEFGEDLVDLLAPKPSEIILDLGCGTGHLTHQISLTGAKVTGIDPSENMISEAKKHYPDSLFIHSDLTQFDAKNSSYDAIFSNATIHWIKEPEALVKRIQALLKPGGRLVAEFGGKGNVDHIVKAVNGAWKNPWYFPSLGEYATLLEKHGFQVEQGFHFSRPTKVDGTDGLASWIKMFMVPYFSEEAKKKESEIIQRVESQLKPAFFKGDHWMLDYVRIRVKALKRI